MAEQAASHSTARPESPARAPWDQRPGENDLWYARFLRFVALGPTRSVSLVSKGRRNYYPVPAHWPMKAKQEDWSARAKAFDAAAREDPHLVDRINVAIGAMQLKLVTHKDEVEKLQGVMYVMPPDDDEGFDGHRVTATA